MKRFFFEEEKQYPDPYPDYGLKFFKNKQFIQFFHAEIIGFKDGEGDSWGTVVGFFCKRIPDGTEFIIETGPKKGKPNLTVGSIIECEQISEEEVKFVKLLKDPEPTPLRP